MQTRIILHGGNSNKKSDKNDRFFDEIINGIDKDIVRVLCVYFARPEGRWENSYMEDQSVFRMMDTDKDIDTKLATYDMEELLESIAESDVIFINGGFKGRLKETLLTIGVDNFRQMIQGKTLVGISAGANILGRYYYSQGTGSIREGVGLLDTKIFTHYSTDIFAQLDVLKGYGEDLPIITIPEEEHVVVGA